MKLWELTVLAAVLLISRTDGAATQKFQADKFLDMLFSTFGQNAFVQLNGALQTRLGNDTAAIPAPTVPVNTGSGGPAGPPGMSSQLPGTPTAPTVEPHVHKKPAVMSCGEGPAVSEGATVTYTSSSRMIGSRAFYQCATGFKGQTRVIQCKTGGVWSSLGGWEGCKGVDCTANVPQVPNGSPSFTKTTAGATVTYTCINGFKSDDPSPNVTCQANGQWTQPLFLCDKKSAISSLAGGMDLGALSAMLSQGGGGQGSNNNNALMSAMMKGMPGQGGGMPGMGMPGMPGMPGGMPGMSGMPGMGGMNQHLPQGVGMPPQVAAMMARMGHGQQNRQQQPAMNPMAMSMQALLGQQNPGGSHGTGHPHGQHGGHPHGQHGRSGPLGPGSQHGQGGQNGMPAPHIMQAMMASKMNNGGGGSGGGQGGPGDMMSMMQQMMGGAARNMYAPPTTTTPAPPPPEPQEQKQENQGFGHRGFQLPAHLMGLLPNNLPQGGGIRTRDLMTLASAGLGSSNPHARPTNIMSLLSAANPMSLFGGGSPGAPLGAPAGGARGGPPVDPEKAAERREDMMMRMMMAQAMRGVMTPRHQPQQQEQSGNETQQHRPQRNPMQDMMTMMALSQMAGGGEGRPPGGPGGMGSMMSMMSPMSLLGAGGGGGGFGGMMGGLGALGGSMMGGLGNLFGSGGLGSLFGSA